MILQYLFKKILRRTPFQGQDRLFHFLFNKNLFNKEHIVVKPIIGDFKISCDTSTWIGAKIAYNGDYEPTLKAIFKSAIKAGDTVVDVGANIGFHTLYFAELVGDKGKVIAFEPVPYNFNSLEFNISINNFSTIEARNIALSDKNEQINIGIDTQSKNPGAFNLFNHDGDTLINCFRGDDVLDGKIDFIKVDVEGYESFVISGLFKIINKNKPKIIFEYDSNYHLKTGLAKDYIFNLLSSIGYSFSEITKNGLNEILDINSIKSANILATTKGKL